MLTVEDDSFWTGNVEALEIADELPAQQESVSVVGYPTGGDNVCVSVHCMHNCPCMLCVVPRATRMCAARVAHLLMLVATLLEHAVQPVYCESCVYVCVCVCVCVCMQVTKGVVSRIDRQQVSMGCRHQF